MFKNITSIEELYKEAATPEEAITKNLIKEFANSVFESAEIIEQNTKLIFSHLEGVQIDDNAIRARLIDISRQTAYLKELTQRYRGL